MKLRRLLMSSALALSFVVSAPTTARADPITAAIVTAIGFTGTAAAVATFVVNSALYAAASFAASKVAGALTGKSKQALKERQASVTSLTLGEAPREAILGLLAVGGSLADVWNWGGEYGTDNVTRNIILADHECEGLEGYYVDDVYYPYLGSGVQPGFNGTLTIDFRNATADGHAPPDFAVARGWEEDDRMTSMAHVWVTTKFDEKVWTQGQPRFRWVVRGLRCFDERNGDVWEDRSTHSFSRNPAVLRYALARGIYAEGHHGEPEHLLIGRGLSADEAPPERMIAPANVCDEHVDGVSRYYADAVIGADMDFITVEQMFADAMAGVIVQHEGGVEVEPGQAKAVVVTITDADLVVGEQVVFSPFLSDADGGRINTVVPRFIDPAQGYVDHSGPVRRDLDDIAEDGGPREMTLALPIVTGAAVADRNAEIARRLARLEGRASIVLPPEYAWLEEGDWIAWTSDRFFDGATVRFRIEGQSLDEAWRMRLSLREIASSVYGVPDPIEDTAEAPPPPVPVDALTLPGASAEAILLPGEASVIPAVRFTWDTPVDGAMRAIRGEVRVLGETDAAPTRFEDLAAGVGIATGGVAAGQTLQARLVPIGDPTRPVLPSAWFTVTTGELVAGDIDPTAPGLRPIRRAVEFLPDILGRLDSAQRQLLDLAAEGFHNEEDGRRASVLRDEIINDGLELETAVRVLQISQAQDDIAAIDSFAQTILTDLESFTLVAETQFSELNDNLAIIDDRSLTTVTDLESLSEDVLTLGSEFGSFESTATSQLSTLATGQSSQATALTLLSARTDDAEADLLFLGDVTTDLDSAISTLDITLSAAFDGLESTVSVQATAIQGLEDQNGIARFDIIATASGGNPARLSIVSDEESAIALVAEQIWFGENTVFDNATDTFLTLVPGGRRLINFGPFGADGDLLMWLGPTSGTINRGNADFFLSSTAPYVGGNALTAGGGFAATVDVESVSASGPAGTLTTASGAVNVSIAGGTSGVSFQWVRISGDAGISVSGTYTPTFSGTVVPAELKQAVFVGIAQKAGAASQVYLTVSLQETS
ncbi:MAG: phage tail protein [Brevundimonas sp.]|uniref:phage tail protein n=1 Tax=Brevundimonas sp. TaxID=1871086 RepID=UPI0027372711|nr:phage tail protein [Brevundimonas sp.]MDP3405041.1 phage tail protein [Brevundimonas sp.]